MKKKINADLGSFDTLYSSLCLLFLQNNEGATIFICQEEKKRIGSVICRKWPKRFVIVALESSFKKYIPDTRYHSRTINHRHGKILLGIYAVNVFFPSLFQCNSNFLNYRMAFTLLLYCTVMLYCCVSLAKFKKKEKKQQL